MYPAERLIHRSVGQQQRVVEVDPVSGIPVQAGVALHGVDHVGKHEVGVACRLRRVGVGEPVGQPERVSAVELVVCRKVRVHRGAYFGHAVDAVSA